MDNVEKQAEERKVVAEYTIRIEDCSDFAGKPFFMYSVYSPDGGYVGTLEGAKQYFEIGILPELSRKDNKVCSIGKSLTDGKWYGWSHRAIYGFQIGDEIKEGDCAASSGFTDEYLKEHPEEDRSLPVGFVAKSEEDCKKMAIAFADSVA